MELPDHVSLELRSTDPLGVPAHFVAALRTSDGDTPRPDRNHDSEKADSRRRGRNAFVTARSRRIWSCAGKRAESVFPKERIPNQGLEGSRREEQVVVAPVVGALMHLCIHISAVSAPETSRVRSRPRRPPRRALRRDENDGARDGTAASRKKKEEGTRRNDAGRERRRWA